MREEGWLGFSCDKKKTQREVDYFALPAWREDLVGAVEDPPPELADGRMTLAEALWGWRFPNVSVLSRSRICWTASAMTALRLLFKRRSLRLSSSTFSSIQSRNSRSMLMVNLTTFSALLMPD